MGKSLDRAQLLHGLGYGHPQARELALALLYDAGLTSPRKSNIAADKEPRVRDTLADALILVCERCEPPADEPRRPVPADEPRRCEVCGGSANRLAVESATAECRAAGVTKVAVVGGAPTIHRELAAMWPTAPELRIISGTDRHTRRQARTNLDWADVVLIWGSTELDHKVSQLYTDGRHRHVVAVARRGIEALAEALREHLRR